MLKSALVLLATFIFLTVPAFAEIEDSGFQTQQAVRVSTTDSDDSIYLARLTGFLEGQCPLTGKLVRFAPFVEYQHEFESNVWWRKETGAEVSTSFFDDVLYYGASFQYVWQQERYYEVEILEETVEWESRLVITPPVEWGIFKDKAKLRIFDEYTYDFTRGQVTINQVGAAVEWQLKENLKIPVGWRHIDRIHDFDSDLLEASVLFTF